jgi:hypothetical protein
MATQAQTDANRLNALKSTGPRTPEGKAKSRGNALKLGLSASAVMIGGEDSREMAGIGEDYYRLCPPANAVQRFHFENVVYCDWMIRRCRRIEAELMNHLMAKDRSVPFEVEAGVAFLRDAAGANALYKLHRRMASLEKSYYRSLRELEAAGARLDCGGADSEPAPASSPECDELWNTRPTAAPDDKDRAPATEPSPLAGSESSADPDSTPVLTAVPAPDPAREIGFVLPNSENAPGAPQPADRLPATGTGPRRRPFRGRHERVVAENGARPDAA